MNRPILESKLIVPAHLTSLNAIEDFKVSFKNKDGEEINFNFFNYNEITDHYEFARGNLDLIHKHFGHLDIEDRRVSVPMASSKIAVNGGYGIQFTGSLKPNQQPVVDYILKNKEFGQIKAPPRWGKTVVMTYLTCKIGLKTLFLSHQVDLSKQALKTFYKFTNILDVEYESNKKHIGLVENWEDLDKYDICFLTYQKFISGTDAVEMLEKYKDRFGLIFVDECHKASSDWYSKIVSAINSKYRFGVSGTTERKDKMHLVNDYTIGPVVAEGEAEQVPCEVQAVKTYTSVPYSMRNPKFFFNKMYSYLANHEGRNELLFKYLLAYAQAGHYCIAVSDRLVQVDLLVKKLVEAGIPAEAFHRKKFKSNKKAREKCLERCREGETRVLIAYRPMVLGIDLPRFTAFFNLLPTAHPQNYYQEFSRVRTPFPGKELAYIVDFVDSHQVTEGCFKARQKVYDREGFSIRES